MTEQAAAQVEQQAPTITIKISLPDTINVGLWQVYMNARLDYQDEQEKAGKRTLSILADVAGAVACIKRGYVHVEGPEEIVRHLKTEPGDDTPAWAIGVLRANVCVPIEVAAYAPLPGGATVV